MGNSTSVEENKSTWKITVDLGTGVVYTIFSTEERFIVKHTGVEKKMKYHVNQLSGEQDFVSEDGSETILAGLDGNLSTLKNILAIMLSDISLVARVPVPQEFESHMEECEKWEVEVDFGTGVVYKIYSTISEYIVKITGYEKKMTYHVNHETGLTTFIDSEKDEKIGAGDDGNLFALRTVLTGLIAKISPLCVLNNSVAPNSSDAVSAVNEDAAASASENQVVESEKTSA